MRVLLTAADLIVGDDVVGQGRITSIVSDANEVDITFSYGRYVVAPDCAMWVERKDAQVAG